MKHIELCFKYIFSPLNINFLLHQINVKHFFFFLFELDWSSFEIASETQPEENRRELLSNRTWYVGLKQHLRCILSFCRSSIRYFHNKCLVCWRQYNFNFIMHHILSIHYPFISKICCLHRISVKYFCFYLCYIYIPGAPGD